MTSHHSIEATHALHHRLPHHTDQDRPDAGPFGVENRATLQINLKGTVNAKASAKVAYRGDVKFSRKGCWPTAWASF